MMFYHGSDKKRHKDQVRKVAFTLQFLGDRTNFLHGTTVFGTAVCCYQTCVTLVNKMATRDAELLVRSLSKRKSTGSMLMLTELNKRISLQERVYRKRKLKSMVICLLFLLSHCTVKRLVWQWQRSNAWFELAYETFSDNEWFENFRVSRNTFHFLSPEPHGFFTTHVISEIVTQTDVSIKKQVRTRVFSGFGTGSPSSIYEQLFICWPLHCYVTRVICIFIRICMGKITIVSVTYEM